MCQDMLSSSGGARQRGRHSAPGACGSPLGATEERWVESSDDGVGFDPRENRGRRGDRAMRDARRVDWARGPPEPPGHDGALGVPRPS